MKDRHPQRCRPSQIHNRTRGVCMQGKGGDSPEAFLCVCLCLVPRDWVLRTSTLGKGREGRLLRPIEYPICRIGYALAYQ